MHGIECQTYPTLISIRKYYLRQKMMTTFVIGSIYPIEIKSQPSLFRMNTMAEVSPSPKPEAACCTTVEQVIENGDELPQRYTWRDSGEYGPIDSTVPLATEIPVIDVGRLPDAAELIHLRSALTSWGCFQVVNHGIDDLFLDEVRRLAREFFHLPMAEKQKYARQGDEYEGYGNDVVLFENQPLDWNDRLYLQVAPDHQQKLQYWPQNPESFR